MATLKKLQAEKDSGEWESLNEQAREQVINMPYTITIGYKGNINKRFQIPFFVKSQATKRYHTKILLKRFHLNATS